MEGVFLGAVEIAGVKNAKVEQTKCVHKGDAVCEYRISW
jgi:predicted hydrocarbon binding protein